MPKTWNVSGNTTAKFRQNGNAVSTRLIFFFKQKTAYEIGLGIPAEPLFRSFSVLVIRLRSLRLLRVSGIVMRLRMFLLLITFLKASHSFRNRLLVICKNAYLFATMIMTSVSSPFSC